MSSNDMTNVSVLHDEKHTTHPPLPPDLPSFQRAKMQNTSSNLSNFTEHLWASAYPDVQKACFLARVCPIISPKVCRLKDIPSILQEGPTCGLAALSMLGMGVPSADDLLEQAKKKCFTRNGEMFSASNLLQLIETNRPSVPAENENNARKVQLHSGRLQCDLIQQVLMNGGCLLVPYDADFNHGPCLRKGHRAHWALIIGYLIDDEDRFFVFARHGKTRNVAIWPLKTLSDSNANLVEFEKPKGYPDAEFELPVGGIGGDLGLCNKCIIIEHVNASDIVVL